jgi:hypothetical protein
MKSPHILPDDRVGHFSARLERNLGPRLKGTPSHLAHYLCYPRYPQSAAGGGGLKDFEKGASGWGKAC